MSEKLFSGKMMLRVSVTTADGECLGVVDIVNDGTGNEKVGHYNLAFRDFGRGLSARGHLGRHRLSDGWVRLAWRALGWARGVCVTWDRALEDSFLTSPEGEEWEKDFRKREGER